MSSSGCQKVAEMFPYIALVSHWKLLPSVTPLECRSLIGSGKKETNKANLRTCSSPLAVAVDDGWGTFLLRSGGGFFLRDSIEGCEVEERLWLTADELEFSHGYPCILILAFP